mmetsp:Transcript_99289/g.269850  ORF Transcript_99289/g.269850 Transcript_99289/m.269850 type:complete len:301 (-) Transcript_99289:676-1578(-)
MRLWHCCAWRPASSLSRASLSFSCVSRRRRSDPCSSLSPKLFIFGPITVSSSCSRRFISARLSAAVLAMALALASERCVSRSASCFSARFLSRFFLNRSTSWATALLRSAMDLYCAWRPCLASSWSRCASPTCFRCASSCLLADSVFSVCCCSCSSFFTSSISFLIRWTSPCTSCRVLPSSPTRLDSSSSSSLARTSASWRAARVRSASSRSATRRMRCSCTCAAAASASDSRSRRAADRRCASLSIAPTSFLWSSQLSMRSCTVRQSRSVSSYSSPRRLRSSRWNSTSSRCSSSRLCMR